MGCISAVLFCVILLFGGIIALSVFGVLFILMIILQIVLSRRKNAWVGLIMPGLAFGTTAFLVIFLAIDSADALRFWDAMQLLGIGNIPTAIYLLIYFICRKRKKKLNSASETVTGNGIKTG